MCYTRCPVVNLQSSASASDVVRRHSLQCRLLSGADVELQLHEGVQQKQLYLKQRHRHSVREAQYYLAL
jgi:hypothetical protein